jgi:hypothetical protein
MSLFIAYFEANVCCGQSECKLKLARPMSLPFKAVTLFVLAPNFGSIRAPTVIRPTADAALEVSQFLRGQNSV